MPQKKAKKAVAAKKAASVKEERDKLIEDLQTLMEDAKNLTGEIPDGLTNNPDEEIAPDSLDAALIALQKTFSRLSRATAKKVKDPTAAVSLIQGPVEFNLKLRASHYGGTFTLKDDGPVELTLDGTVQTDIRSVLPEDIDESDDN